MKRLSFLLPFIIFVVFPEMISAQQCQPENKYSFFLTGASFAVPVNGWFELGCEMLDAKPINKAIGGTAIADLANKMSKNELYTQQELEEMDALVIMHVVNRDVFNEAELKTDYDDYTTPFDRSNYAAAFDYVIKRYLTECYQLKFDESSAYYETPYGKPAVVVLCTDWHDARVVYNASVRQLAAKWGFPLVEFDRLIGFSDKITHPVTGERMSTLYSFDRKTIEGVEYGWHPNRGKDKYIQKRMAAIFAETMREIFP